jgi:hypothetical protein
VEGLSAVSRRGVPQLPPLPQSPRISTTPPVCDVNANFVAACENLTQVQLDTYNTSIQNTQPFIILDWDDTLLCTWYLKQKQYGLSSSSSLDEETSALLEQLSDAVYEFLSMLLPNANQVYIITNAQTNWCELSAAKFLPKIQPLLSNFVICSARDLGEPLFPADASAWKRVAFHYTFWDIMNKRRGVPTHYICIGDSDMEHMACRWLCKMYSPDATSVCVKLEEQPSVERMLKQLAWLTVNWKEIYLMRRNVQSKLDL